MATAGQRRLTNAHDSQRRPRIAHESWRGKAAGGSRRVGLELPRYIFFFYFTPTNVYLDYVTFSSHNNEKRQRRTVSRGARDAIRLEPQVCILALFYSTNIYLDYVIFTSDNNNQNDNQEQQARGKILSQMK